MPTAIKPKVTNVSVKSLVSVYAKLLDEEKRIDERKREILDKVRGHMDANDLDAVAGADGEFREVVRESLSWTVEQVKELFPKTWQTFVVADNKLLKAKAESDSRVLSSAKVEEKKVVTFVRK